MVPNGAGWRRALVRDFSAVIARSVEDGGGM